MNTQHVIKYLCKVRPFLYVYTYFKISFIYLIVCMYSGMYGDQKTTYDTPCSFSHVGPGIKLRSLGLVASTFTLFHFTSPIISSSPFLSSFFRIENTHLDSQICGQFVPLYSIVQCRGSLLALGHDKQQSVVSTMKAGTS